MPHVAAMMAGCPVLAPRLKLVPLTSERCPRPLALE